MKTIILPAHEPEALSQALSVLQAGGLVAFPTDTVYGLAALAFNPAAVEQIFQVKGRPVEKALPVLIADLDDLVKVAQAISSVAYRLAACFWPGPLTLIVLKHPDLPEIVSDLPTVGIRIPDHALARSLLHSAGPMAVTSANLSGQNSPSTALEVFAQLGGRIGLILDGGRTPGGVPSTVVDCARAEARILREGPVSKQQIHSCLAGLL
jgi:L-threonylcarbamoyladenylate synthase